MKRSVVIEEAKPGIVRSVPKVLFIDLDGTVVNSRGELDPSVKETIQQLQQRCIKVAIATGRPYFAAGQIIRELGICSPSLFFSGALIVDPASERVCLERGLSPEMVSTILETCESHDLFCELYARDQYYVPYRGELSEIHYQYLQREPTVCELSERVTDILKAVIIIDRSTRADVNLQQLEQELPNLHLASAGGASHPSIEFVNITSQEASRESCFEALLSIYQVPAEDVMAIGDASADIPFLKMAGTGIAMGNAQGVVKQAANYITRGVDQNGFAFAMKMLISDS